MKVIKSLDEFYIPGRGKIFSADRKEHDFELLDLMKEVVSINGKEWKVIGIESTMGLAPGRWVGLLVKEIKGA